ncbi:MAG: thioredoxin domain-containing protein [Longimicrobiales bacterium]|nr:thioredoxin domain-containing protein [Longimicrobiales bacterium]
MPNRLAEASSPYLRQHAGNPVDWYPWGPEALERARADDRPILLSVGYSACHWCHVMERESFSDDATASLMNAHFVNVKVDREERPDVDALYMRAVQALTGRGGWPLTAFLTPEGAPFFGGTYFPPEPRHGMPAFRQVLHAVAEAWRTRRGEVMEHARALTAAIEESGRAAHEAPDPDPGSASAPDPGAALAEAAYRDLEARFDATHGGFGGAPKFPQPVTLEFLLAYGVWRREAPAVEMVVHTLRRMAAGGLRDHLGGGFHRYSVDAAWGVPHFEKMLYDNALLARLYLDAWRVTGAEDLREVCEETLDYLLRDLRAPEGAFYAARDADSEGEEGRYYVWTPASLAAATRGCDPEAVRLFTRLHPVEPAGNFEGATVLSLPHPVEAVAHAEGLTPAELRERVAPVRQALLRARAKREAPFRDEKVICSWNAFAVRALAEAGAALDRDDLLAAARAGGRFLADRLAPADGVRRIWADGRARIPGFLEDWAALGNAFLSLHEATLEPEWLSRARMAGDGMLARFLDADGLLYDSPSDGERLVVRPRDLADGATPSGNALAVELFLRGGALLDRPEWSAVADDVLAREAGGMARFPSAFGRLLAQVVRREAEPLEVVLAGPPGDPRTRALLAEVHRRYHPARVVAGTDSADDGAGLRLPAFEGRAPAGGAPSAWVCRHFTCRAPVTDAAALSTALDELKPGT